MTASRDWATYESKPAGTDLISVGDDEIRNTKVDIRQRMDVNHLWGDSVSTDGRHTSVNCKDNTSDPATIAGYGTFYAKTIAGGVEAFYIDAAGNVIQLTTGGILNAVNLAGDQTVAGIKTFSSLPTIPLTPVATTDAASKGYVDGATSAMAGMVTMWAGALASPPSGWFVCDGSAKSRTTYATLFGVIGVTFGAGDLTTTFNVPNMTNKFVYGASEGVAAGNASVGSVGGLTPAANDNAVTLASAVDSAHKNNFNYTGADASTPDHTHNVMPPYVAVGYIIKY